MSEALVAHEAELGTETWSDPVRGEIAFRTVFGDGATAPDLTAGVSTLEVGGWLGHHRHEPAELYYVLSGEGTLTIDGEDHAVTAGTVAYIPSNSEHGIRNTGDGPLRCFYVFAVSSFEQIDYHFTAEQ